MTSTDRLVVSIKDPGQFCQFPIGLATPGRKQHAMIDCIQENQRIKITSKAKLAFSFIRDLKNQLGKSEFNGLILVVLNMEKLMALLKFVVELGPEIRTEFVKIFKGYVIIEPLIRTECLIQEHMIINGKFSIILSEFFPHFN